MLNNANKASKLRRDSSLTAVLVLMSVLFYSEAWAQAPMVSEVAYAASDQAQFSNTGILKLSLEPSGGLSSGADTARYIDKLIEPGLPGEQFPATLPSEPTASSGLYQSVNAVMYYVDDSAAASGSLSSGLDYIAFKSTHNYGDFRLNLVALNEGEGSDTVAHDDTASSSNGLTRYSLEQIGLPLTSTWSMDNIVGTHRQAGVQSLRSSRGLVSSRFNASEPEILGVTSRVYSHSSGITVSAGQLGSTFGALLPAFEKTSGNIGRVLAYHATGEQVFSAELWDIRDSNNDMLNRTGSRINWQGTFGEGVQSGVTLALSGDSVAGLATLASSSGGFEHEGSVYYFEPNFTWLGRALGDDFAGAYYRFNQNYGTLYYGGSIERRRNGLDGRAERESDAVYTTANGSYRLSRASSINATYTYRDVTDRSKFKSDVSRKEQSFRASYSRQHGRTTRSVIGGTYGERESGAYSQADYYLSHDFSSGSRGDIRLEYSQGGQLATRTHRYRAAVSWQGYIPTGGDLTLGASYNHTDDVGANTLGWDGFLNYSQSVGRHWLFAAQLNYNRAQFDVDSERGVDDLFTDLQFDDFETPSTDQFSARINLRYSIGGNGGSTVLGANGSLRGAGSVIGRLFLDSNGDGVAQSDEKGLAGVVVYLNSIYPVTTNARGEFNYPAVSPGDHHLFVDESALPLPWSVNGIEYTRFRVRLRSTARVNIPVRNL